MYDYRNIDDSDFKTFQGYYKNHEPVNGLPTYGIPVRAFSDDAKIAPPFIAPSQSQADYSNSTSISHNNVFTNTSGDSNKCEVSYKSSTKKKIPGWAKFIIFVIILICLVQAANAYTDYASENNTGRSEYNAICQECNNTMEVI